MRADPARAGTGPNTQTPRAIARAARKATMIAVYVIKQYERAVVFKLGKGTGSARGPGLIFVVPFAQRIRRVSLRIVTMPIQSQGIITKDNVSIDVSAVAYYRV